MNLPMGAILKSASHSAAVTIPRLPKMAASVVHYMATPRPDTELPAADHQEGFAVKNVVTSKTLSREGVQVAPQMYAQLLTGQTDKVFAFTPWVTMAASLNPTKATPQATSTGTAAQVPSTPATQTNPMIAERYEAEPVILTMAYNKRTQSLNLVPNAQVQPIKLPTMSVTQNFERERFTQKTASFVQNESLRTDGLEPPQLLGWADLCNMFYILTRDKAWIKTRDACLHRIDTSSGDKELLAPIDSLAKDGDLTDTGALKSKYSQLMGRLNPSSKALPVMQEALVFAGKISKMWEESQSLAKFVEKLNDL